MVWWILFECVGGRTNGELLLKCFSAGFRFHFPLSSSSLFDLLFLGFSSLGSVDIPIHCRAALSRV
jgi:hypothetical protein